MCIGDRHGADAFGNALGQGLVDSMQGVDWSRAPDENAAESARLERSGNRYAAWPDQTDAESARLARQGHPYAYWPDQTGAESARLGRYENKARFLENAAKVWAAEDAASAKAALAQQHRGADAYRRELAEAAQRAKWDAMQAGAWSGRTGEGQPVWHAGAQPMAAAASGSDNRSALIAAAALGGEFSVLSADLPPDIASGYAGPAGAIGRDPVGSGVGLLKSAYNNTIGGLAGMAAKGGAYLEAGDMLWSGAVLGTDTREDAMALMRAGQAGEQLILAHPRSEGQLVGMALGNTSFAMTATAGAVEGGVALYNGWRAGSATSAAALGDVYSPQFVGPVQWEYFYRGDSALRSEFLSSMAQTNGLQATESFLSTRSTGALGDILGEHGVSSSTSPFVSTSRNPQVAEYFARGPMQTQDGVMTTFRVEAREAAALEAQDRLVRNVENPMAFGEPNPAIGLPEAEFLFGPAINPRYIYQQVPVKGIR